MAAAGLMRAAIRPKIVAPVFVSAAIACGVIWILSHYNLWTLAELKDTIVWFVFSGVALIFRGISARNPERAIRNIPWDALKLTVLMEFILNTYTFPLVVEILLFPVMAIIIMASTVADLSPQLASIRAG